MKLVSALFYTCLVLAAALSMFGFFQTEIWVWSIPVLATAILWGLASLKNQRGFSWLAFASLTFLCVVGLWLQVPAGLMLVALCASLAAWDLDIFKGQLNDFDLQAQDAGLVTAHLRRLGIVIGVGLLLGALNLVIRIRLGFILAVFLGLLAFLGFSKAVGFLRREAGDG